MSDPSLLAAESAISKNPPQMSVEQFAQKVKAKYPVYSSIPDAELTKKVLDKYPQYHSVIHGEKLDQPQRVQAKMPSASQQEVHNKAEYLPAAGATVGGILGHGWLSVPGAALGGAAGEAAKQLVNRVAGEGAPDTSGEAATDIGKSGAVYGALEGGTMTALKGAGWLWDAVKASGAPLGSKAASLAITKAINPATAQWPGFMAAIEEQTGNIAKVAKEWGIDLTTQRGFAKAAKQAADESNNVFKSQYIDPVAKEEISVGSNYHGRTTDPHRATLGDIYARIGKINDELRPSYTQTEQGIIQSKLANEGDLLAEKESLTRLMESKIGQRTGASPEAISTIRRRTAQLYQIADHTEAASNARSSAAGKVAEGQSVPTDKTGAVGHAIEWARGGREKIADRTLAKTLKRTQIPTTDVPVPPGAAEDAGTVAREAARAGRASERQSVPLTTIEAIKTDENEIAALQQKLTERVRKNIFEQTKQSAADVAAKHTNTTTRAARAAEQSSTPTYQSAVKTTGETEIEALRTQLAERIKRNNAAKEELKNASGQKANRLAARKQIADFLK